MEKFFWDISEVSSISFGLKAEREAPMGKTAKPNSFGSFSQEIPTGWKLKSPVWLSIWSKRIYKFSSGKQKDHWWVTPNSWWPHAPAQLWNMDLLEKSQLNPVSPRSYRPEAFYWVWLPGSHNLCLACLGSGEKRADFASGPWCCWEVAAAQHLRQWMFQNTFWLAQPRENSWGASRAFAKLKLNTIGLYQ